jgi:hypothetical protein
MAATKAGKVFVEISAKDNMLSRVLAGVQKKLAAFGAGLRTVGRRAMFAGAAIAAPLIAAARSFAASGANLWDMSKRTGASVETLSELGYAADQTGASLDDVGTSLKFMNKGLVEAARGSGDAQVALAAMGLDLDKLLSMNTDQRFAAIAEALNRVQDPALKSAFAMMLFGRSGTSIIPMLEELNELRAQARQKGFGITTEEAKNADILDDAITDVTKSIKRAVFAIGSQLAPVLTRVANGIASATQWVTEFIKQNKGMVTTVLYLGAGLVAAGVALTALGFAVSGLAKAFGLLAIAGKVAFAIFGAMKALALAIATPVGAVIAIMAVLVGYLLTSTEVGAKALAWLGQRFGDLAQTVSTTVSGIVDALKAGDVSLAAKILWAGLRLAWAQGVDFLRSLWSGFTGWLAGTWNTIWTGSRVIGEELWHGIKVAWINGVAFIKTMLASIVALHQKAVEKATGLFTEIYMRRDAAEAGENARKRALDQGKSKEEAAAIGESTRKQYLEEGNKYAERQRNIETARIEDDRKAKVQAANDEAKAALAGEDVRHNAAMENLAAQGKARDDALRAANESERKAAETDLARLQQELATLRAEAAGKAAAAAGAPGGMPKAPDVPKVPGMPDGADFGSMSRGIAPRGLFNVSALQSLQGDAGDYAKQTASNTKRIADKTQKVVDAVLETRTAFA